MRSVSELEAATILAALRKMLCKQCGAPKTPDWNHIGHKVD